MGSARIGSKAWTEEQVLRRGVILQEASETRVIKAAALLHVMIPVRKQK